jgi:uncharacterized membrane protein YphA (DoxX/SURF4 family)
MFQQDPSWMVTAGKWMLATLFLVAGTLNVMPQRAKDHIERMKGFGVPLPAAPFWIGIAMEFAGCAMVLTGWHAAVGVWLLIAFTVIAGAMFHRFWLVDDPMRRHMLRIALLNNVAVIGGLLVLLHLVRPV